jgi:hypothetical protein
MAIENLRTWRLRVGAALRRWMPTGRRVRTA